MRDWPELLEDLGQPRPLPPALRARLEAQLLGDDLAGALTTTDVPRPLPAEVREALAGRLLPATVRLVPRWRRPGAVLAAAAAVVGVVAGAALLSPDPRPTAPTALSAASSSSSGAPVGVGAPPLGAAGTPGAGAPGGVKPAPTVGPTLARRAVGSADRPRAGAASPGAPAAAPAAGGPAPSGAMSAPRVVSLTPASGPLVGGNTVTVSGSGFTAGSSVTFGGARAQSVQVVSATELQVVAPAHLPGQVDVVVTTAGGSSVPGDGSRYRYVA